ncbi:MAG: glycosyltransferase family 1 protein [Nevskia sp.]|nr:glycosyltransferase family 1 protein [Nevskia sp.]
MPALILNYSFLPKRLTGLGVYAENVLPAFASFDTRLVAPRALGARTANFNLSPDDITSDLGSRANLRRLAWTERALPRFRRSSKDLVFSPVPEAPLFSCRKLMVVHDLIPLRTDTTSRKLKLYFQLYVLNVIRRAELVVTDSEATRRDLAELAGLREDRVRVVPLGVDFERFSPIAPITKQRYLIYVGRHDRYKNITVALEAFSQLDDRELRFRIVGPEHSIETPILRAHCSRLGIESRVDFASYVSNEDLVELIRGALALVHLSAYEGFGLTVLEAMAAGTAVVCSRADAISEVVGSAALQCDPQSTADVVAALNTVTLDSTARMDLERRGLAHVRHFSWDRTRLQMTEIIREVL